MAKIGIMSMQRIINYGSFLQAYGLKGLLEDMGHEVEFVDYHVDSALLKHKDNIKHKDVIKLKKALRIFTYGVSLHDSIKYILYKKDFSKNYWPILGLTRFENYYPKLDLLIIGSDEVFNCIQENENVGYSLDLFGRNHKAKRLISYAASFGNTTTEKLIKFNKKDEINLYLKSFDAISVRDENSVSVIENMNIETPFTHVDPVLVYDFFGKKELVPKLLSSDKYLIVYAYSGRITDQENAWIKKYAIDNGLKVYSIGGIQKCADRFIDCSPFEVLSYFVNAKMIVTDTFHGSIFSIITKSEFITIVRKSVGYAYGNEEKLTSLLKKFKLEKRIANSVDDFNQILNKKIDYSKTQNIINYERTKSIEYLTKQIGLLQESVNL